MGRTWGFGSGPRREEKAMDAREGGSRQVGGDDAITIRLGAVALPLGVIVIAVSEYFHPAREDPMDNVAVFMEYAHSDIWTAVHQAGYGRRACAIWPRRGGDDGGLLHGPTGRGRRSAQAGGGRLG